MDRHQSLKRALGLWVVFSALVLLCNEVSAQELAPRAYWPTPNGTNVLVVTYQKTIGDIVTDPSLPLTGVDSDIDYLMLSYQRTFSLAGRTAVILLSLPSSRGETEGVFESEFRRRETSGLGDARVRLAYNLRGARSMDAAEFKALRDAPHTIVGASWFSVIKLRIERPTINYLAVNLVNA